VMVRHSISQERRYTDREILGSFSGECHSHKLMYLWRESAMYASALAVLKWHAAHVARLFHHLQFVYGRPQARG
jgi:hypothetical protein